MTGLDPTRWHDLFIAEAGAAAALAGLLFVAISINLKQILAFPTLPIRAASSLVALMVALVISTLVLVPGQGRVTLGIEVVAVSTPAWLAMVIARLRHGRSEHQSAFEYRLELALLNMAMVAVCRGRSQPARRRRRRALLECAGDRIRVYRGGRQRVGAARRDYALTRAEHRRCEPPAVALRHEQARGADASSHANPTLSLWLSRRAIIPAWTPRGSTSQCARAMRFSDCSPRPSEAGSLRLAKRRNLRQSARVSNWRASSLTPPGITRA